MDYVQYALQGQIKKAAEESFDCVQCGLCAIRCPAEIPQYHVGMLARRLHGKYNMKAPENLEHRVKEIEDGVDWIQFRKEITDLFLGVGADFYLKKSLIDI